MRDLLAFERGRYATLAGLILREEYFDRQADFDSHLDTKRVLDNVAFSWIGPVFFVELGTQLILDWDVVVAIVPYALTMTVGPIFAQVLSAALAARYTSAMRWPESWLIVSVPISINLWKRRWAAAVT